MFHRKVLSGVILVAVLGGGVLAGNAYSSLKPHNHQLKLTADHGDKRLMVQESTLATTYTSTSFSNLTADTIAVPASGSFRVQVRVTAESACDAASWCSMAIFVDGVQTNPKSGSDFAFDSPGGSTWVSNAMQGTSDVITGTGTTRLVGVRVDVAVIGGGSWRLDDWNVSAELWKI